MAQIEPMQHAEQITLKIFRLLALAITSKHAEMKIDSMETPSKVMINCRPHAEDYGKLVGTGAVMLNAFHAVFAAMGLKLGKEIVYSIGAATGRDSGQRPKFRKNPNWNNGEVITIMKEVCEAIFTRPCMVSAKDFGDSTIIILHPSPAEPDAMRWKLCTELGIIFHAIAKAKGRNEITVEIQ